MVADEDIADAAAGARKSMKMLSGLELLEIGEAEVQGMVEQVVPQALVDAFAYVGPQIMVCGVEAGA